MKTAQNIFVSFLAICILSFSGGISIMKHYCGTQLKQTSINQNITSCCKSLEDACTGYTAKKTCCVESISFYKTSDFEKVQLQKPFVNLTPITTNCAQLKAFVKQNEVICNYALPPPKIPIYKKVNNFLI